MTKGQKCRCKSAKLATEIAAVSTIRLAYCLSILSSTECAVCAVVMAVLTLTVTSRPYTTAYYTFRCSVNSVLHRTFKLFDFMIFFLHNYSHLFSVLSLLALIIASACHVLLKHHCFFSQSSPPTFLVFLFPFFYFLFPFSNVH